MVASVAAAQNPKDELSGVKQDIKAKKQLITKTRKVEAAVSVELKGVLRNLERITAELA